MSGELIPNPTPHITKPVYALSHSDGVSAKITHVALTGSNYTEWAKGFRNGLGAKRKLGFVDGSLKRPAEESEDLDDWSTANYTEEEVRHITQETPSAMAFAVQNSGQGTKQGKPRLKCSHCKKPGHSEPNCWDKYGYPEGRGPRSGAVSGTGASSSTAQTNAVFGEPAIDANHIRLQGPYLEDEDW